GPRRADRAAWHRPLDRRHLSFVLPRQCRRLAGRRPRNPGGCAHRLRPEEAAGCEGDDETWRKMAAVARGGRPSVVGLLSCREAARGRAGARKCESDVARGDSKTKNAKSEWSVPWPLNSTGRGSNRKAAKPSASWCSCTATAPTATT